ncbi:MAG: type II toxin-antitoxin system VapC family toxin [Atopobiaceae bacterium]|nr:type II toxin-antitoxin system VapC family toxin [Atopobiaceae bacterium]
MYLLDTNVISERMKVQPSPAVIRWLDKNKEELYLPAVVLDELRYGVMRLPEGRRKEGFTIAIEELAAAYVDKIVPFDAKAAWKSAEFRWQAHSLGFNPSIQDMMVAGIAAGCSAVLATRNVKDFAFLGIEIVNPFE